MKKILISIKPEWVCKILNGKKTIEVRRTAPKCELPIEVYIYCTKSAPYLHQWTEVAATEPNGIKGTNKVTWEKSWHLDKKKWYMSRNGKVVAKFTLRKVEVIKLPYTKFGSKEWVGCEAQRTLQTQTMDEGTLLEKSCLEEKEIYGYLNFKYDTCVGYAWHIEDLEIFNEPKELDEFDYTNPSGIRYVGQRSINGLPSKKRPPQSWCYVEEKL